MGGWRDKLVSASFRGVEFGVTKASDELGRRTVRHDFPQRDDPYVEDLGRAPRVVNVTGFVLGPDYMSRRDQLQQALDAPGPGTLSHPWYGALMVSLTSARVEHSATDGGMAVFTLAFVRVDKSAREERPAPRADHVSMALSRAEAAASLVEALVDSALSLKGIVDQVLSQPLGALMEGLGLVGDFIGVDIRSAAGWVRRVSGGIAPLYKMIKNGVFGASLRGLFSRAGSGAFHGSGSGPSPQTFFDAARRLKAAPVPEAGLTRSTAAANAAAVTNAIKQFTVIEALRGTAAANPASRDQAQVLRGEVMEAVDAVIAALPATPQGDATIAAFEDLRASVLLALAGHAGQGQDIRTVTLARALPALAVAWRYAGGQDIEAAEADLIARNGVGHPGFVPAARALEIAHG